MSGADAERVHRGTIHLEDAEVLQHEAHADRQFTLRVQAPRCAALARPGSFAHIRCGDDLPMRRPLSIMRADRAAGWVEFLYKTHGHGLSRLAHRRPGDRLSVLGPIGRPFSTHPGRPRPLLLGGGVGIPPMVFLAESLAREPAGIWRPLVLMGSEIAFPFTLNTAPTAVAGLPDTASAALDTLELQGIPSRLASLAGLPGCFAGYVTELAHLWLSGLDRAARSLISIHACGPTAMLRAAARLAQTFDLPCQVSLEEYMACAVGGCAGCAVPVRTPDGPAMKRVCVDGPVFEATQVFF